MNSELAHEIRDRIREDPQEIRVCCPRGHFVANITLTVPDDSRTALILMQASGPEKPYAVTARAGAHGFLLPLVGAPLRALAEVVVEWEGSLPPGEVLDTLRTERGMSGRVQGRNVQLKCTRGQCTYSGERQYDELAIELAKAALAGKPEYRLTS